MNTEERLKRLDEIKSESELLEAELALKQMKSNTTRARSITVGTAFGGVTEISMRGEGSEYLWVLMQPVEVTEFIHQLAGSIGCHINVQPRNDFASWRSWRTDKDLQLGLTTQHPTHPNDIDRHWAVGTVLPAPEEQPGLTLKPESNNESLPLAATKNIDKRKSKRTPKTT